MTEEEYLHVMLDELRRSYEAAACRRKNNFTNDSRGAIVTA